MRESIAYVIVTKNFARSRSGSDSACSERVIGESKRKFNDDSVSDRRDDRLLRRVEGLEMDFPLGGRATFEGDGAGSVGVWTFFLF